MITNFSNNISFEAAHLPEVSLKINQLQTLFEVTNQVALCTSIYSFETCFLHSTELRQLSKSFLGVSLSGGHCSKEEKISGYKITALPWPSFTFPREAALWSPAFLQWQALRKSSAARRRGWLCLKGDLSPSSEAFLKSKRHRGSGGWVSRAPGLWVQLLNCIRVIKGAALKLGKKRRLSIMSFKGGPDLLWRCSVSPRQWTKLLLH